MSTELVEWIIPLFFLGALVLVSRFDRQISSISRESYRLVTGGISVLVLVSLVGLYRSQGMLDNTPFLSEAVFFDLLSWILGITGSVFILSGVARWLPLSRDRKQFYADAVRKLELLKRTEQLLGVESRLDPILTSTVEHMVSHLSLESGAVYKYSSTRKRLHLVGGTTESPSEVRQVDLTETLHGQLSKFESGLDIDLLGLFASVLGDHEPPAIVLPLWVNRRPVGFFVLWSQDESTLTKEDVLTLKLTVDAIVRKIETDKLALQYEAETKLRSWKNQLEIIVSGATTAREVFGPLVQCLGQRVPIEFSALALIDNQGERMRRLSWGPGGRVLVESGLAVPSGGMLTAPAYQSCETVIEGDLKMESQALIREIVTDDSIRSLLAAPIVINGQHRAVITFTSSEQDAFGSWELHDLELARPVLERLVAQDISDRESRQRDRQTSSLSRFVRDSSRHESLNEVFAEAAGLIADQMNVDIVRISTPNTGGAFLKSRTLVRSRSFGTMVPANGELIVSLMPLHEQVLRDNQPMMSGGDEHRARPVDFEQQQVFASGVESALIVPVSQGGQVAAVISVASMSNRRHLHRDIRALTFVKALANCLIPAIQRFESETGQGSSRAMGREITGEDSDIVARISDSLERRWSTSSESGDEMIDRYRRIIERPSPTAEDLFEVANPV